MEAAARWGMDVESGETRDPRGAESMALGGESESTAKETGRGYRIGRGVCFVKEWES